MLTQDDNKQLAFDAQTVLCQCQGQAIDFVRHSATNSNVDFQTKVKMTKVGRVVPPVVEQPPCSQTAASFVCGQEAQCYLDPECGTLASATLGSLGCNANGVSPYCRFCGGSGAYSANPCPSSESKNGFRIEQVPVDASPMPFNASGASGDDSIVMWDFEINDLRQPCGGASSTVDFWTDALNRRITWKGLTQEVSVLGNT